MATQMISLFSFYYYLNISVKRIINGDFFLFLKKKRKKNEEESEACGGGK
jgi:hypothetical protein